MRWTYTLGLVTLGVVLSLAPVAAPEARAESDIFKAATLGKLHEVRALLDANPKLARARNKRGMTALHYAAKRNRTSIAKLLIEKGARVGARNKAGRETPLHLAAGSGSMGVVEVLLANKADPNAVNDKGSPALHTALRNRHADIAHKLLEAGADLDLHGDFGSTLHYAAAGGVKEFVEKCLAREGYGINDAADSDGDTPLHKAAWGCDREFIAYLIGKGAEVDARSFEKWTPLHEAAKAGNVGAAEALLEAGAELEAVSKNGLRPLHTAVIYCGNQKRKRAFVKFLLVRKADIDAVQAGTNDTPLHSATIYGDKKGALVKLLLGNGADPSARNKARKTALDLAKEKRHVAAATALEAALAR